MESLIVTQELANGASPTLVTVVIFEPDELETLRRFGVMATVGEANPMIFVLTEEPDDCRAGVERILRERSDEAGVGFESFHFDRETG